MGTRKQTAKNESQRPDRDPVTGKFLPGNKASPGRPPGRTSLVEPLKEKLREIPHGERRPYVDVLLDLYLRQLLLGLKKGAQWAMREMPVLIDRVDGRPSQRTELEVTDVTEAEQLKADVEDLTGFIRTRAPELRDQFFGFQQEQRQERQRRQRRVNPDGELEADDK